MERFAKQLTAKYALLQSTYWISECMIYSFAAVFLHYKNFDNTQIGIVLSLSSIFSIILQPLVASYADRSKQITLRWLVLILMFIVMVSTLVLFVAPNNFLLIAIVFIIINTIQFTLNPLFNSLAFEYMDQGIPINYGLARGTGSIVFAVASYFIGITVNQYGAGILMTVFLISYFFLIASAFIFRIKKPSEKLNNLPNNKAPLHSKVLNPDEYEQLSPDRSSQPNPASSKLTNPDKCRSINPDTSKLTELDKNAPERKVPTSIIGFFLKYRKFSLFLIGVSMIYYSHSILNTYLINIIENVGGNSADMGLSLTIAAALELPVMAAFIFLVRKFECNTLIKVSALFYFIKALIALLAPSVPMIYLSQVCQLMAFALFTPASVYYVSSIIEDQDKVKGQSMLGVATLGIAGTTANITGGRILDGFGVSYMLLVGTIVAFIGFIIICFTTQKTKVKGIR